MSHAFVDPGSSLPDTQKEIQSSNSVSVTETFTIERLEADRDAYQAQVNAIQAKIDAAKAELSIS